MTRTDSANIFLPKSSCVCIPCFKSVAPRICLVKVPFLALFFFVPDIKNRNGCGHIHVPKTFPRLYIYIYIWFHGLTP